MTLPLRLAALLALCTLGSGCLLRSALRDAELPPGGREVRDVAYWEGEGFDPAKHRLDLYVPPGPGPHPVVVFVHGGGWRFGDRQQFLGPYVKLGRRLAAHGVLAAIVSYRLSPQHKHPAQVRDVARALAWTLAHAAEYGGDPRRVYPMGHSAGAHLVALAATDPRWLAELGAAPGQLAGVVAVSGPYDVEHLGKSTLIGGVTMVIPTFGEDAAVWREVMPAHHLRDAKPPGFFVAWADGDYEVVRRDGRAFAEALAQARVPVESFEAPFEDHFTVITDFADGDNPLAQKVLGWISRRAPAPLLPPGQAGSRP